MIHPCTHLFFEALASSLRLKIVDQLIKGPATVGELTKSLKAEQSRVSHALTALSDCKLVTMTKDGKKRIYSVDKPIVGEIIKLVIQHEKEWCAQCARIKK